jgi:hypothetical protein
VGATVDARGGEELNRQRLSLSNDSIRERVEGRGKLKTEEGSRERGFGREKLEDEKRSRKWDVRRRQGRRDAGRETIEEEEGSWKRKAGRLKLKGGRKPE